MQQEEVQQVDGDGLEPRLGGIRIDVAIPVGIMISTMNQRKFYIKMNPLHVPTCGASRSAAVSVESGVGPRASIDGDAVVDLIVPSKFVDA